MVTRYLYTKNRTQMRFKKFVDELLRDERGRISIKPTVAMVGASFLCFTLMINSFTEGTIGPTDHLVDAVLIITSIGMGADTLDKFSYKKTYSDAPQDPYGGDPYGGNGYGGYGNPPAGGTTTEEVEGFRVRGGNSGL